MNHGTPSSQKERVEQNGARYHELDQKNYVLYTSNARKDPDSNVVTVEATYCTETPTLETCEKCYCETHCHFGIAFKQARK